MGLRKKIAVSGKYKGTECEDGAVHYEPVRWAVWQKPIIIPQTLLLSGFAALMRNSGNEFPSVPDQQRYPK